MTTFARPEDYEALAPLLPDLNAAALNRIATALEQIALALMDDKPKLGSPLAALPPVAPQAPAGVCPVHRLPWKLVPGGVSKKSGNAYEAFQACPERGCDQRPPR